jgi:hypothetical protein
MTALDQCQFSTIAPALPSHMALLAETLASIGNNHQPAEPLARQINRVLVQA